VTNLGLVKLASPYDAYVESLYATLSMSKNQNLKAAVVSYKDTLVFTFSSAVREVDVQKVFFRKLAEDGIDVSVETNGVYYE
jgi:pyruvate-formate lyase-activating enzyme